MNDRLNDLMGSSGGGGGNVGSSVRQNANVEMQNVDVEMGGGASATSAFMQSFFDEVAHVKKLMSTIKNNIRQIEQNHGECLIAISSEQGRDATARLEQLMKETNGSATQVRNMLKAMDSENKDFASHNKGAAEARIRTNMHGTLTRKFVDLMGQYQEIQNKYKNKYRERVERQFKIVKPDVTRAEIDDAFDGDPNHTPEIFTQQIMQGPGHAAARNALADAQEKHRDIMKLEASIQELHQLFLDMSIMVETQGELLDQIEYTVAQSVNFTGKAVEELRVASKYQKKVRKKMCCVAITLLVILAVILIPLLANRSGDS